MLYFYILTDPDKTNRCKVGITKNPDQRIKAYKTACPKCSFTFTKEIDHRRHEKHIISVLKDVVNVESEYVHASPQLVQNIVEGYFIDLDTKD